MKEIAKAYMSDSGVVFEKKSEAINNDIFHYVSEMATHYNINELVIHAIAKDFVSFVKDMMTIIDLDRQRLVALREESEILEN